MAQLAIYLGADRIISACGITTDENMAAISRCESGVKPFREPSLASGSLTAGRIAWSRLEKQVGYTDFESLLATAVGSVIAESGVDPHAPGTRLIVATTKGNIDLLHGNPKPDPRCLIAESVCRVAEAVGVFTKPIIISNACISGVAALIVARRLILSGQCTDVVVAGADILSEFIVAGFQSFKSVSENICRPYDKSRDGLSLGEACGAVLLTSDPAKAKGQPILLAGGAVTQDANHLSAPSRTGEELASAMQQAMQEAGVSPQQVDLVNAHGTATLYNDEMECRAVHLAELANAPLNSLKPYLGHTLGAAGVVETILTAEQLRHNKIFGTLGYTQCGVPLEVNVSAAHKAQPLAVALKSASGFGGCNAALVLSRHEGSAQPATNSGVQQSASFHLATHREAFATRIRQEYRLLDKTDMRFFKMDNLSKLGYIAAGKLLAKKDVVGKYGAYRVGIILANHSASLDSDLRHQQIIDSHPAEGASPSVFVYTLPSIVAGEISIRHSIKGEGLFFIEQTPEGNFAPNYARMLIATGKLDAAICGWCDYLNEAYEVNLELLEKI